MNGTVALRGTKNRKKEHASVVADTIKCFKERKKRRADTFLLVSILALVVVGVLSLASASHAYAYHHENGNSGFYFVRQLIFACIGVVVMMAVSYVPVKYYCNKWVQIIAYIVTLGMLGSVFLFPEINGVHRWITIGSFSFQPSEVAKFVVIMLGAYWGSQLYPQKTRFRDLKKRPRAPKKYSGADRLIYNTGSFMYHASAAYHKSLFFYLTLVLGIAGLIVVETHLSCTIIILGIAAVLVIVSGCPRVPIIALIILAVLAVYVVIFSGWIPYSSTRINVWRNPEANPQGEGWQTLQSLYAIGNGGIFGQGITNSTQKHLYISEPHNDFIFAVICEEVGFVGALMIIALFLAFVYRGFVVSAYNPDRFSKLLGVGIAIQVGIQAMLNIGVVTNTIPNTGISLPFFSYGGTSLVVLLAEMGVLLSISRETTASERHRVISD